MIIRKPYALLIKNFRLIHFIMLLISVFIFYKTNIALKFFNEYVSTRQFIESTTLINDIVPISLIIFSVLMTIFSILIIILFRKKDKPTAFYIYNVLYFIIFIIICFVSRSAIRTIMFDGIDPRVSRIIRDIWLIAFLAQIIIVAFYLVRTLGFDIKKFNFGEDLNELQIDAEDNEEVEITTRFDADKVKMKSAMQREELKAFYYENKMIIITILILLFIVIPGTFVARNIIANRKYSTGQVIDLDNFNFKVVDSYITKRDYAGRLLFNGKTSYLVVKINIENNNELERGLTLDYLRLEVNNKIYMPKTTHYSHFSDLGTGYIDQKISNKSKDFIIVYVVNDEDLINEITLRYTDKLKVKDKEANAIYHRIVLNPNRIDKDFKILNSQIGEELIINVDELKNAKLNITHFNVRDKFTYEYNKKTKYIINNTGLLLSLKYDFASEIKNSATLFSEFLEKYGVLRYVINDLEYNYKIVDITPKTYFSNDIFLAVNENIKDATSIDLVFNIRNVQYVYKIK